MITELLYDDEDSRRFLVHPLRCIATAKGGSRGDTSVIADHTDDVPREYRRHVVEMFCKHLRKATPSPYPIESSDDSSLEFASLEGIARCDIAGYFSKKSLANIVHHHRRDILRWMMFFFDALETERITETKHVQAAIYFALTAISTCESTDDISIFSESATFKLVAKLWVEDTELGDAQLQCLSLTFSRCCSSSQDSEKDLDTALNEYDANFVAEKALGNLRAALEGSETRPFSAELLDSCLTIILKLMASQDSRFRGPLLEHYCVYIVTRVALRTSRELGTKPDHKNTHLPPIRLVLGILYDVLNLPDGELWIQQAFRGGILEVLVNIMPFPAESESSRNTIVGTIFLSRLLTYYLIYPSVLDVAIISMRKAATCPMAAKIHETPFVKDWHTFDDLLLERASMKGLFDRLLHSTGGIRRCSNRLCKLSRSSHELRLCAGCQSAVYCSRECQKISWKNLGHRQQCKILANIHCLDKLPTMNYRDREFIIWAATRDIRRHSPGIRSDMEERFPNQVGFSGTAIKLCYTKCPLIIKTFSAQEVKDDFDKSDPSGALGSAICDFITELTAGAHGHQEYDECPVLYIDHVLRAGEEVVGAIGSGTILCTAPLLEYDQVMGSTGLKTENGAERNLLFGPARDFSEKPLACLSDEIDELVRRLGLIDRNERWIKFPERFREIVAGIVTNVESSSDC